MTRDENQISEFRIARDLKNNWSGTVLAPPWFCGLGLCLTIGLLAPRALGCRQILTDFRSNGNDLYEVCTERVGLKTQLTSKGAQTVRK